ncbi:MAG: hypothetical protein KA783_04960 [Chitinophagales bacterium]|jgi:F0F1-type ATP synthase membrane subunit b/b'|nr:hypothetical protein [Chitinophagales bacterium]
MPLVTEGEIMFMNELALFKYGKSIDQMFEEIKEINAKEEQLLAQRRTETEQLLAQKRTETEQLLAQKRTETEQLLAQKRTETEQLLAQQKAEKEQAIVNMYQKLALDVATIANILNVSTDFVQEVLSKNNLG